MQPTQKQLHVGIYGLIEKDNAILVIRKSRGPYKGLFDLPGGRPLHGEPLLEALSREIKEETNLEAKKFSLLGNFSFLVPYQDVEGYSKELYHIALIYRVMDVDLKDYNPLIKEEDADGSLWISKETLRKEECSPIIRAIFFDL